MLSVVIVAAYMVAFLFNKRALTLLFATTCCEFIGWSPLFSWSYDYYYGMLTFIVWGAIYATYILLESTTINIFIGCGIMVLFQLIMGVDSRNCNGYETALYISYEYILIAIHCYIVYSFIARGDIVRTLGGIIASFRGFVVNNVFNVVLWYTMDINQKTKSAK
jgi:hypothetical protein